MSPAVLDAISDMQVRALLASGAPSPSPSPSPSNGPQVLLEKADPEIRASVARALMSEEFAQLPDGVDPRRIFDDIVGKLRLPTDLDTLKAERALAIASKDAGRVRELTARILKLSRVPGHA
jgi:hypothetical protein